MYLKVKLVTLCYFIIIESFSCILSHIPVTNLPTQDSIYVSPSVQLTRDISRFYRTQWKIFFVDKRMENPVSRYARRENVVFSFIRETNNLIDVFYRSSRFFSLKYLLSIRTSRRCSRNVVRITYVFKSLISSYFASRILFVIQDIPKFIFFIKKLVKLFIFMCIILSMLKTDVEVLFRVYRFDH